MFKYEVVSCEYIYKDMNYLVKVIPIGVCSRDYIREVRLPYLVRPGQFIELK